MMERYEVKRFLECFLGDPTFGERLRTDRWKAVEEWGIPVDPDACWVMVDREEALRTPPEEAHPKVREYRAWIQEKVRHRRSIREAGSTANEVFAAWRKRQLNRFLSEVSDKAFDSNVHAPWSFELTKGCSVGCDYCGFAAGKLTGIARFTPANEKLFRDVLDLMADFFGRGAENSVLYNATEPLDNPDYERYLTAFFERFGRSPQTTTAAWLRNVERTRRLLNQHRRENGYINRFSVNSYGDFKLCMERFSAKELDDVELILQYPESHRGPKAGAGRGKDADPEARDTSIACTTGFRLNLADRTARLVSPTWALKRWPVGEMTFATAAFDTAQDLKGFVEKCRARILEFKPDDDFVPRFREDLALNDEDGRPCLRTPNRRIKLLAPVASDLSREVDGRGSVDEIVTKLMTRHPPQHVYREIRAWWKGGLLEDPFASAREEAP